MSLDPHQSIQSLPPAMCMQLYPNCMWLWGLRVWVDCIVWGRLGERVSIHAATGELSSMLVQALQLSCFRVSHNSASVFYKEAL